MLVLVWAALLAAVGIPLMLAGVTRHVDPVVLNVIATIAIVVPVTLALAALEASRWHATVGKRALGIRVVRTDAGTDVDAWGHVASGHVASGRSSSAATAVDVSFGVALLRNSLKIALPWVIGHAAVIAIVDTSTGPTTPAWVWMLTAAAYLLPIVYIVSLFVRHGRTLYDLAAGTAVIRREP